MSDMFDLHPPIRSQNRECQPGIVAAAIQIGNHPLLTFDLAQALLVIGSEIAEMRSSRYD